MPDQPIQPSALEQAAAYEQAHPELAEALRLFGMSAQEYDRTLDAMSGVKVTYTASETNTGDLPTA